MGMNYLDDDRDKNEDENIDTFHCGLLLPLFDFIY
jgi:hypothetical protein